MKQNEFTRGIVAFSRFIVEFPVAIDEQLNKWVEREYITPDISNEAKEPLHTAFQYAVSNLPYAANVNTEDGIQSHLCNRMEQNFLENNKDSFWNEHAYNFILKTLEKTWPISIHAIEPPETQSDIQMKKLEESREFGYPFQLPITALAIVTDTLNDFRSPDPSNPYSMGWCFGPREIKSHGTLCRLQADVGDREITGLWVDAGGPLFEQYIAFKAYKSGMEDVPVEGPTEKQIVHQFKVALRDIESGEPKYAEYDKSKLGLKEMKEFCWQALATLGIEKPTYGKPGAKLQ